LTKQAKSALIFGVSGQDGAYLAEFLLRKGYTVYGASRDAEMSTFRNLEILGIRHQVSVLSATPMDFRSILQAIMRVEPDEIYNLSGQSSVGMSFGQPGEALESIAVATMNFMEVLRIIDRPIRFYNAGSSECFGDLGDQKADERTAFRPRSPYAVAKAAAHWQISVYRDTYNIHACSGILFNHESPLRPERFVTRKIIAGAARIAAGEKERLTLGDLSIRRDWGWAPEYVVAMWKMLQIEKPGDFVIATGESHTLEEFVAEAFAYHDLDWHEFVDTDPSLFRISEIRSNLGDASLAERILDWSAQKRMKDVVHGMVEAEQTHQVSKEEKQ
jgi:GDPmannose 4,6-dehydratase